MICSLNVFESERYTMPDIDLDIPDNRRESFSLCQSKIWSLSHGANCHVWYDGCENGFTGRCTCFRVVPGEANRWSAAVPNKLKITLEEAYQESKRMQKLVNFSPNNQLLYKTAVQLEGLLAMFLRTQQVW